jgi:hypothetical protein
MEYRPAGTRYADIHRYDQIKHRPYDYKTNGLLKQVLPEVIVNTTNSTTRIVLDFIEHVAQFLLSYVDELKNFKNPNAKLH